MRETPRLFIPCFVAPAAADDITHKIRTSARKNPGKRHVHRCHAGRRTRCRIHVRKGQHIQQPATVAYFLKFQK